MLEGRSKLTTSDRMYARFIRAYGARLHTCCNDCAPCAPDGYPAWPVHGAIGCEWHRKLIHSGHLAGCRLCAGPDRACFTVDAALGAQNLLGTVDRPVRAHHSLDICVPVVSGDVFPASGHAECGRDAFAGAAGLCGYRTCCRDTGYCDRCHWNTCHDTTKSDAGQRREYRRPRSEFSLNNDTE